MKLAPAFMKLVPAFLKLTTAFIFLTPEFIKVYLHYSTTGLALIKDY